MTENEKRVGLAGPVSPKEEVAGEGLKPEVSENQEQTLSSSKRTPEFMEVWSAHCKSLMKNPTKSGGT